LVLLRIEPKKSQREVHLLRQDNAHVHCPGVFEHLIADLCAGKGSFFSNDTFYQLCSSNMSLRKLTF